MKRKRFFGTLSYDRADPTNIVLHDAGIQMGRAAVGEIEKQQLIDTLSGGESFGMFGGGGINNSYYPTIGSANDIIPKPEDYIDANFRLLTATTVGAGTWKATDFSNTKLLKASMPLLGGKPVYRNHDLELDNFSGFIKAVSWEPASEQNGIIVPAGINGILALDAKTDPRLCRGVLSGAVYSNSVTVEFDWEMSHPFEDEWEFINKVGTIAADGTMIRRIVKNIYNYHETSLVFLGADPFAKLIDADGNLRNIDTASISYDKADPKEQSQLKDERRMEIGRDGTGICLDKYVVALSREKFKQPKNTPENKDDMKELLAFLTLKFGVAAGVITEANYLPYLQKLELVKEGAASFEKKAGLLDNMLTLAIVDPTAEEDKRESTLALVGEGESLALPEKLTESYVLVKKEELTSLELKAKDNATVVAGLQKDADLGKTYLGLKRAEAIRLYKISMGDKASEAVVGIMNAAEGEALDGLLVQYTKGVEVKFKPVCKTCNSGEHISFQSSLTGDPEEEIKTENLTKPASVNINDIRNKYDASPMNIRKN